MENGTLIEMRRYECTVGTANKFWGYTLWSEGHAIINFGKIGYKPNTHIPNVKGLPQTKNYLAKKCREKERKGYVLKMMGGLPIAKNLKNEIKPSRGHGGGSVRFKGL